MTVVRRALGAGSDTRHKRGGPARSKAAPALGCLGVAAVISVTLFSPVAPAGANQVSTLQAQAQQLSQQMLLEQLQITAFDQQRTADMAAAAADETQLHAMQAQLDATNARIAQDLRELRRAAVKDYVDGGTQADGATSLFASTPTDGPSSVYAQVMTGNLSATVTQLNTDRHALRNEEAAQKQIAAQAAQQVSKANAMLADAQSTESTLAQQHSDVTGQLAVALSQQQAAQAAAARAAAAQAAAAAQQTPPPVPVQATAGPQPAPAPSSGGTGALPALNPFLTCVVQAESGGDYQAVSPTGQYMGAFQFSQPTWNEAAQLAGLPQLIGVRPNDASPRDQDLLAIALYNADGEQPWYDPCRG